MSAVATPQVRQPEYKGGHATSAAAHVTRSQRRGSRADDAGYSSSRGIINPYSYFYSPKLRPVDQNLAAAGAFASLYHAGSMAQDINKLDTEHPLREPTLGPSSSHAAYEAGKGQTSRDLQQQVRKPSGHRPGAKSAATGAISTSRGRAESAPMRSDLTHAVTAATTSQRYPSGSGALPEVPAPIFDIRKLHSAALANTQRKLYPEQIKGTDEHKKQQMLHASAETMAKQMYMVMPEVEADVSDRSRPKRSSTFAQPATLHDTAQRLVSERLAMMYDENQAFRDYYNAAIPPRSRGSVYMNLRRRASSESGLADIDQEQSRKIGSQMTDLRSKMARVDAEQRARDHDVLLKAAKRNSRMSLYDVDQRIFESTGRPPSYAIEKFVTRPLDDEEYAEEVEAIPIGGGQFVTQEDVERVAQRKRQPAIDDIMERLEEKRARALEQELDERERQRRSEIEREREEEARQVHRDVRESQRRTSREEKEKRKFLNRRSKDSGGLSFRRKSSKAQGKVPAKDETVPASGAIVDSSAQRRDDEIQDLTGVPEKQNSPPRSHVPAPSAGESSRSIRLVNQPDSSARQPSPGSNKSVEKTYPRPMSTAAPKTNGVSNAGAEPTGAPERKRSESAIALAGEGAELPSERREAPPSRTDARQWSTSTEGPAAAKERQRSSGSRPSSRKPKWHLRLFGRPARTSEAPGSFSVERDHAITQTPAPASAGDGTRVSAGSEAATEPLQTITSQQQTGSTPVGNQSKFRENL
ncbi:hypothetical protein AJ79_07086 [Helicocarpus griseus UAMH5409]|uniref:Uncharacterized protein n=1 Tax=Helicocarpus griseus UAMH5409 TaxID=1447875 RepID=A0A2B7X6A7_9EURO|nr:hypothetical protein AJ79_07086 [Helicocarpus griseus UAMH5409]